MVRLWSAKPTLKSLHRPGLDHPGAGGTLTASGFVVTVGPYVAFLGQVGPETVSPLLCDPRVICCVMRLFGFRKW